MNIVHNNGQMSPNVAAVDRSGIGISGSRDQRYYYTEDDDNASESERADSGIASFQIFAQELAINPTNSLLWEIMSCAMP